MNAQQLQISEVNEYVLVAGKKRQVWSSDKWGHQGVGYVHPEKRIGNVWPEPAVIWGIFP